MTTFAITKLEEQQIKWQQKLKVQYYYRNIEKKKN